MSIYFEYKKKNYYKYYKLYYVYCLLLLIYINLYKHNIILLIYDIFYLYFCDFLNKNHLQYA